MSRRIAARSSPETSAMDALTSLSYDVPGACCLCHPIEMSRQEVTTFLTRAWQRMSERRGIVPSGESFESTE